MRPLGTGHGLVDRGGPGVAVPVKGTASVAGLWKSKGGPYRPMRGPVNGVAMDRADP